ncbi:MAG: GlxA family transcriptional regulator [Pseudomonadales bacterium]|nr:GlxA family transcriptional regulator [Pseudomonadales bacterium]
MNTKVKISSGANTRVKTSNVGFLLLGDYSMIALASAVEPLRMANQLSGKELYSWYLLSADGNSVQASIGMQVQVDASMSGAPKLDTLIVAGGINITKNYSRTQLNWLRAQANKDVMLGSICTGAYTLADAGLLDGYDCSAHWEYIAPLQEAFPKVNCNRRLFTHDRNRLTCSGGGAPMDMMLYVITMQHGRALSGAISDMFICDRVRSQGDQQRVPLRHLLSTAQPKLVEIAELMEANIEEPIELDELASFVSVSRRQLERLFHRYLDCTPSRYYLKLRLERARQLLKQTTLSILEVSSACGFVSPPHFSRCYRKHIGFSPSEDRTGMWSDDSLHVSNPSEGIAEQELMVNKVMQNILSAARAEPSFASVSIN